MSACGISRCLRPKDPTISFRVVTSNYTSARYVSFWRAIKQGCRCPTLIHGSLFNKERDAFLTPEGYSPIPGGKGACFREPAPQDNVLGGLSYFNQLLGKVGHMKRFLEAVYWTQDIRRG